MKNLIKMTVVSVVATVLLLTSCREAKAQERYRTLVLSNAFIGTPYAPMGTTNTAGITNNGVTIAGGYPVRLADAQNIPSTLLMIVANPQGGTNGVCTNTLDFSYDDNAQFWVSNQLVLGGTVLGGSTNIIALQIPVIGGTNAFTNVKWARWGSCNSFISNQVFFLTFQLINYR